jgi:hypothetical protein
LRHFLAVRFKLEEFALWQIANTSQSWEIGICPSTSGTVAKRPSIESNSKHLSDCSKYLNSWVRVNRFITTREML